MTTPVKVANKIDDFAIEISIADISSLTKGLLQLQHARYPHLVPMYRTVHRTKPRAMVLRAIRWVNPKRMFPGAGLTRDEMQNMSSDELEKLIVDLNDYRGEAHVIHNRYNHMIELINMGELPYFIPYAGFKQDKWSMLQEYMDRALRLKDGTEAWEQVLDRQAIEIRNILLKREGGDQRKLDDIDGLWVDAKGQPAAPNFMDIKKGKEKKIALRQNRLMSNGKRVRHAPKVFVRRFAAVHPQEARRGEVIRMPAMGKIGRPGRNRPTARRIFDKHGGAAGHLVRMPKAWAMGTDNPELREKGNMISMPAGRKDPMILTFQELDFDAVANRREARWTQPDPLGQRGVVRHRGGASAAPGGHREEGESDPRRRGDGRDGSREMRRALRNVRQRQQNIEDRRRRRRERGGEDERPPADQGLPNEEGIKINNAFREASAGLFQKYNVDDAGIKEMQAITGADLKEVKLLGEHSHAVNAGQGLVLLLTLNNGKKYVYKMVTNEQKSEQISTAIDKILGLNVNMTTTIFNDLSVEDLARVGFTPGNAAAFQKHINNGGGHLQEFCEPDCVEAREVTNEQQEIKNYKNPEFRGDLHRMHINDWLTGNWDRHRGNYMIGSNGRAMQIDTGFAAGLASVHNRDNNPISDPGRLFSSVQGGVESRNPHTLGQRGQPMFNQIDISKGDIQKELEAVFDEFVTVEKIKDIQEAFGMRNKNENMSIDELKQDFINKAGYYWGTNFSSPVDTFGQTAGNMGMDTNDLNPLFGKGGGGGAAERPLDSEDFEALREAAGPDTQADRDANAQEQQESDDRRQQRRGRELNTADRESLDRIAEQVERDASEDARAEEREIAQEAGASERRGAERRRQERTSTPAGVRADEPRGVSGFTDSPGMRGGDETSRRGMTDEDFDISEDEDRNINTSEIDRALASDEERDFDDESMSGKGDSRVQTRGSRDTLGNRN